jgi:hypothetical protein
VATMRHNQRRSDSPAQAPAIGYALVY